MRENTFSLELAGAETIDDIQLLIPSLCNISVPFGFWCGRSAGGGGRRREI